MTGIQWHKKNPPVPDSKPFLISFGSLEKKFVKVRYGPTFGSRADPYVLRIGFENRGAYAYIRDVAEARNCKRALKEYVP